MNYFGKYRGMVTNNIDIERMGRLQVSCPQVLGENVLAWAMPCVPFAGINEGFWMMPMIGSNVWVEFEAGNPDRPIWSGCFWTIGQVPLHVQFPTQRTIKTFANELTLDDTPGAGGITLRVMPPAVGVPCTIKCDATGIEITTGAGNVKVEVARVNINSGALQVL